MSELCVYLDWDSAFFHRRIARVTVNRLTREQGDLVRAWCAAEWIDCLYFLADSDDAETVETAEANHFKFVDIRLTLEHSGDCPPQPTSVRTAQASDLPALKAIARLNHRDTRFYYDGHFSVDECDALYETWIERSYEGFADVVLVAERDGRIAGYVTCNQRENSGSIGLLGVGSEWQGQRIGPGLINAALSWFKERGIERVQVVTQGRNVRAQRAYQRCGFISAQVQLWYHHWFERTDG